MIKFEISKPTMKTTLITLAAFTVAIYAQAPPNLPAWSVYQKISLAKTQLISTTADQQLACFEQSLEQDVASRVDIKPPSQIKTNGSFLPQMPLVYVLNLGSNPP
jgi:hypothetical protein